MDWNNLINIELWFTNEYEAQGKTKRNYPYNADFALYEYDINM